MKVSAVIVTYNRLTLLKECLESLKKQSFQLNNIIVVNNNSNDGTLEFLNSVQDSDIISLNLEKNLGGAGGFSEGIRFAYENTDSDAFWIMDDDTMPVEDALDHLVKSTNYIDGDFGFLNSFVKWWGDDTPCNIPGDLPGDWSVKAQQGLIKLSNCTFVSVLVSRNAVKKVGLPKKEMFIWGDDLEYTHRVHENFEDCYMVLNSEVIHKSAKSGEGERIFYEDNPSRIKMNNFWYRNYIYIDRLYFSKFILMRDVYHTISILFKVPFKSKGFKMKKFSAVLKGLLSGLVFKPKVEYPNERNEK